MIRTRILPCKLNRETADAFNLSSGQIYTGVLVTHWRVLRKKSVWLSEKAGTRWSDYRTKAALHAHTIDAAQQGFYKACATTRALRRAGIAEAKFPHWPKKFRTTIWKNTAIKNKEGKLELSTGAKNPKVTIALPPDFGPVLRYLEVRLVYDKREQRYTWHIVVETGQQPKVAAGTNVVSVDLGEVHPAVVGDETEATIILCRERRHEVQGHAKRMASFADALARKEKGSRRYNKLMHSKTGMKGHHNRVARDIEHKVSRAIVAVAVERQANTIVLGDTRDIADGVALGKKTNQKISGWNHGKIRSLVEYKAEAEGVKVVLQDEKYTSQTCPNCGHRHKPRGRVYRCPSCRFQAHRDVVGQINILSAYKHGEPGKIPVHLIVKHRMPYDIRLMRSCRDTGLGKPCSSEFKLREAEGLSDHAECHHCV